MNKLWLGRRNRFAQFRVQFHDFLVPRAAYVSSVRIRRRARHVAQFAVQRSTRPRSRNLRHGKRIE